MADNAQLAKLLGSTLEFVFEDGHVVRGRLLGVFADDDQVIYDVAGVIAVGPTKYSGLEPGTVAAAKLSELTDFRICEDHG